MLTAYIIIYLILLACFVAGSFWDKCRKGTFDVQQTVVSIVLLTVCMTGAAWCDYKERRERSMADVEEVVEKDPPEVRQAKIQARIIGTAIKTRTPILFRYDDAQRIVHPHRVGRSNTSNILMRAWEVQRAGESVGQWRTYKLDKITGVIPFIGERFDVAPDYKSPDSSIPTVFLEIPINNKRAAE